MRKKKRGAEINSNADFAPLFQYPIYNTIAHSNRYFVKSDYKKQSTTSKI